jgi:dTDP-4-dehydrorhamnose 3,5-epimerase
MSKIEDVCFIVHDRFEDNRGSFQNLPLPTEFGNFPSLTRQSISHSKCSVRRGMHLQVSEWQSVSLIKGRVRDLILDCRYESRTYGVIDLYELDERRPSSLILPPGVAHGFEVISEMCTILYSSSAKYEPEKEVVINANSSIIKHFWQIDVPITSIRDEKAPHWEELQAFFSSTKL